MNYLIIFAATFSLFLVSFLIAKRQNKHDYIDIIWGLGFIVSAVVSLFVGQHINKVTLILTALVIIWGVRLSLHLAQRNIKAKEDFRYQKYRDEYKGQHFDLYFFFKMYLFQFVLNIIIAFPVIYSNLNGLQNFTILTTIGIFVWLIGFLCESVADYQLKVFKSNANNKGKLIKTGLWQYSRHPNYFGESLVWWGIYLIAISNYQNYFLIVSPLLITLLVRFVSGVPLLEKKYQGRADWEEYKKETNVFFPMPKKRQ